MPYSMQHWRKAWDNAQTGFYSNADAARSLDLLSRYAGFYKFLLAFGVVGASHYGRFFSGRWRTQHAEQVEIAIANFYHVDGMYAHGEEFHSVEFILALVKQEMGSRPINPEGSLAKILAVIREKTHVNYADLDAEAVIRNYDREDVHQSIIPPFTSSVLSAESSNSSMLAQYSKHTVEVVSRDGTSSFTPK